MTNPPSARETLDSLALVCSQLDSLAGEADATLLAFVGQECRFYGAELTALASRLERASRGAWDAESSSAAM